MLESKLGITDSAELARIEEKISKQKAVEMFENGYLESLEAGTFESLAKIHKYLFDKIYDFAGELRKVNISKGNFRSSPLMYLNAILQSIDKMPQSTFDEIKFLLKNALTDNINDREIYMKGIDHSYYYEGYCVYKTKEL